MSDRKTALDVSLPTYEPSVSCGMYCLGGVVTMTETDYPEYTDAEDVFVRGDIALSALTALRARVAERDEQIESVANMLRGMTMDPAIPAHAKEAMRAKIEQLEGESDE